MKKIIFLIVIGIVVAGLSLMLNIDNNDSNKESKIEHLVYSYQDTYVGDNSSVGGILNDIFISKNIESFSLGTSKEPYSITVNYALDKSITKEKLSRYMEYNATTLFALVKNVEVITFNIQDTVQKTYAFKREIIQTKYDEELSSYITDEETWVKEVYSTILKNKEIKKYINNSLESEREYRVDEQPYNVFTGIIILTI